ncbi:MAG TPA: hypothetical protein VGL57_15270 [Solirubrobacteraceae bacterium]|jgi:hypothetical protein
MRLRPPHAHRTRGRGALIGDLRRAIDCLPVRTREAMLAGVRAEQPIIVGAYVDGEGGVCPMLAAHRRGGRTDFLAFARAWDRFTGAGRRPRRASGRELGVLVAHLEASLLEDAAPDLARAITEHRASQERRRARRSLSELLDPRGEIRARRLSPRRLRERYSASPGRVNMISGTTQAGEVLSR